MLIRFNVKNFLSFSCGKDGKSEEFSMIAGKVRSKKEHVFDNGKIKLLKFAAVYGANAAGKSNLIKALDFMKQTVLNGLPEGHADQYCRAREENREKASYFELELMLGERYFAYGFEVILSRSRFLSEWLIELTADGKEKTVFTRDITQGDSAFGEDVRTRGLIEKLNVYAEDIETDGSVLFLSVMNRNKKTLYQQFGNAAVFQDVYTWIRDRMYITWPDRPVSSYSYFASGENVERICELISAFGTGITGFQMVEVPMEEAFEDIPDRLIKYHLIMALREKMDSPENANMDGDAGGLVMRSSRKFFLLSFDKEKKTVCRTIRFSHGDPADGREGALFDLHEESDGTVRLLDLLEVLLSEGGKTYVIDELDRCLHPGLTYRFVETFLQMASEKKIQLVVTTHESRLLDFGLLRRDEVWFVDKNRRGESDIYSLEEYNARFDQKIDKAYLEGRYGGVPVFETVFSLREE